MVKCPTNTVKLPADAGDDGCLRVAELQACAAGTGPFQEQLRRRIRPHRLRSLHRMIGRPSERLQVQHMLTFGTQRFAARGHDVDARRGREDALRQDRDSLDEVLAGVEDQQHPLVAQVGDQARRGIVRPNRQSKQGSDRGRGQGRVAQRTEIDEHHRARERIGQIVSSKRGLANPAGADDRDEAGRKQLTRKG